MNRIEELFGQALDQAVPETWTTLNPTQLSKLKDKFAELIVRECIDRIIRVGILEDILNETDMVVDAVKEHFGVKS